MAAAAASSVKAFPKDQPHAVKQSATMLLDRYSERKVAPGLSIAVADPQGLRWAGARGLAQVELAVPATPAHLFPLGSVSKVVTATLAARLATRGQLDLDQPIARWLPDLPAQHRSTTLRQLLTHRGGIRHYTKAETDFATPGGPIYTRFYPSDADALRLFIADPLVAAPGTEVRYASYGYTLASAAMAAVAGRRFLSLIHDEIARPFGLTSLQPDDPWSVVASRAGKYMNDLDVAALCAGLPEAARPRLTDGWANLPLDNPAYCWPGAGLLMNPADASRFGAGMIAPSTTVSEAQRALLFTPMTAAAQGVPPMGLGWRIDTDKQGRRRWHHAGATPGGCFLLAVYPDQQLSVALAGNVMTMKMNVLQTAAELVDAFTG